MHNAKTAGWVAVIFVQLFAFAMVIPRLPRFFGKGAFPILLVLGVISLVTLAIVIFQIRRNRALRRTARGAGAALLFTSLAWIAGSLWAMNSNTESMVVGMLSILGAFFWLPLFLVGSALIVASDETAG